MILKSLPAAFSGILCLTLISTVAFAQERASLVGVDAVIVEPLSQTLPVLGRLVPLQRGTVAALSRGPVQDLLVTVGDRVQEGDVILVQAMDRLNRSRDIAQQSVDAARAKVATARSRLALAQQELERLDRLKGSAAFSSANRADKEIEVSVRLAEVNEALADVASRRAQLDAAQLEVDLGVLRAPYNGVIVERHVERGAYVSIGDAVVTMINDLDLEVEADIPTDRIASLTEGRMVGLRIGSDFVGSAVVRAVLPEENALTRTRLVRFIPDLPPDFPPDSEAPLAAGQSVSLSIPIGAPRDIVSVHKDAVLPRGGQNIVFLVQDDKTVISRPVGLGEATGTRFVVRDGLKPGDLVVIRGNERLRPGQAVTWPDAEQQTSD